MKRCAMLFPALVIQALLARGAHPENGRVTALYQRGLAGDAQAVVQCISALEAIVRSEPKNEVARVYLGSAYTLRSRDLGFGPEKLRVLSKGLALMDEAANSAPANARVRLVRALTNQSLPSFLGRRKAAQDEFFALAKIIQREPTKLSANDQQLFYLNAGLAAQEIGDKATAMRFWRLGLARPADPKLTAQLHAALANL